MIVRASWTNYPNEAPEFRQEDFDFLPDWFRTASNGQVTWQPLTVVNISFPNALNCQSEEAFVKPIHAELIRRGYRLFADYRALAVTVSSDLFDRCGGNPGAAGYAYLWSSLTPGEPEGGLSVYRDTSAIVVSDGRDYPSRQLFIHELGHTLGASHAGSLACLNGSLQYSQTVELGSEWTPETGCAAIEYGDDWDPMGAGRGLWRRNAPETYPPNYAPVSMDSVEWLSSNETTKVPLDGRTHDVELEPFDLFGGIRVAKVKLPGSPEKYSGNSPGSLWLEFRDAFGLSAPFYESPDYQPFGLLSTRTPKTVYLRYLPNWGWEEIASRDMGPGFVIPSSSESGNALPQLCFDDGPELEDEDDWEESQQWWEEWRASCRVKDGLKAGDSWSDPFGLLSIEYVETTTAGNARLRFKTPYFVEPVTRKPGIRLLQKPRKRSKGNKATFRLKFVDTSSATCRLDKRKPRPCSNGALVFKKLRPGIHRLRIVARNEYGSRSQVYRWRIVKR